MEFKKYEAQIGDVVRINDSMALVYEKVADDVAPIWHEIPAEGKAKHFDQGTFLRVTSDVWFVFDQGQWRIMTPSEHVEARRQTYMN